MMNRPIDDGRTALVAPRSILVLIALGSALFESGCASTTAMRASASALAGSIWDRSRIEPTPTYDLYAQNMAAARGPSPATPMLAEADSSKPNGESTAAEPQPEPESEFVAAAEPERRKAPTDKNVRITLGRPESLPVLKESKEGESAPPELMAAAEAPPSFAPSKPLETPKVAADEAKENASLALAARLLAAETSQAARSRPEVADDLGRGQAAA